MPTSAKAVRKTTPALKFEVQKAVDGGITLLNIRGTVANEFVGRKHAESVHTKKVVVNLRNVRRFASWGMSEWMDFMRVLSERDVYLVECSTYAVSQINLVTGLLGHAKLVSFYASYQCAGCNEELETLILIPNEAATIRDLPNNDRECQTCGGRARPEEYPASFFDAIAERPAFEIEDEVLALLRAQFKYDLSPDQTRFRAHRKVQKEYTYLRLSGNIATLPPDLLVKASEGTTVVDLEKVIFDPVRVTQWRTYVETALTKAKLTSLQLFNCPIGFPEAAIRTEDLHKLKVRTFALPYDCVTCSTTVVHMVDVAAHLEELVGGTAPPLRCGSCDSPLLTALTADQIAFMRALPARDRDPTLDRFLAKARGEPDKRLENCLVASHEKLPAAATTTRLPLYLALSLIVLLVGALVAVTLKLTEQRTEPPTVIATPPVVTPPPRATFTRPDWITSDVPSSAYCRDMINRLMCVGVSSFRASRDSAVAEASDAALDELVSAVGLKISDRFFREAVIPEYSDVRAKALSTLQAAELDRTNDARAAATYSAAADVVRKVRRHVVESLQLSGGAAVPTQRSDWHWEEYAGEDKKGNETLVFVRYDISLDSVRALVEKYSTTTTVMGTNAITAFPALAWQSADFTGGAMLTKVGQPLAGAGITAQQVVVAIGDQRVSDATNFARRLEDAARGELKLTVKARDVAPRVVTIRR